MSHNKIIITNNKCKLDLDLKLLTKLQNVFKIKSPGAFWSRAKGNRQWDGYIKYITDAGYMYTGLLPKLLLYLEQNSITHIQLVDEREDLGKVIIPKSMGNLTLRPDQLEAVESLVLNQLPNSKIFFPRGVIGAATNAGKTLISSAIYQSYNHKDKNPTVFLLNSTELFEQAMDELPNLIDKKEIGYIYSKGTLWKNFNLIMVKTACNKMAYINKNLANATIAIVDECDLAGSTSYKLPLNYLYNAFVKVGLTGSPFVHKDKTRNENIRALFGELIYTIKAKELINLGVSSEVEVEVFKGNTHIKIKGNYALEYEKGIIKNKKRNTHIVNRVGEHLGLGHKPILVIAQRHNHIKILFKRLSKAFPEAKINWVHHSNPNRTEIVKSFKDGNLDILVGSMILKRGKNFPLMKAMLNGGAGDSVANVLQLLGRAYRKHESKKQVYFEDFFDEGAYLKRHSKHRLRVYKEEGLKVVETYKNNAI